jgi:hypothetical protein
MKKAIRAGAAPVRKLARQLVPVGGPRTGRKSDKKHLRDTIAVRVKSYNAVDVAIVGPQWPSGAHGHLVYNAVDVAIVGPQWPSGAHGHLVEFGYDAILPDGEEVAVPPQPYMRPAAEQTKTQQAKAITNKLKAEVEKVRKP